MLEMGVLWAIGIVSCWVLSLYLLLPVQVSHFSVFQIGIAVLGRAFLHTGLFVIAHDAMHGSLCPNQTGLNPIMGRLMLGLYAFLPYNRSYTNHWLHHRHPTETNDPDFHDGTHHHPILWYLTFMREYLPFTQFLVFLGCWIGIFVVLLQMVQIPIENILLFWILPLILSSMQLFLFGTYLPHRNPHQITSNSSSNYHRAQTIDYPVVLSFLTCYHFGYHWEHHEYPQVPWYQLPAVHFNKRRNLVIDHGNASE
jgi:beta-carotene/zeaxanthin 4-ketolase